MHDLYSLGAVLVVIVVGLLYNGKQIGDLRKEMLVEIQSLRGDVRGELSGLRAEMGARFNSLDMRLDALHRDLTVLASEQGRHDARLDTIERGRAS